MHRECGTLVDLNPATGRAVGKMKATITQRFVEKKNNDKTRFGRDDATAVASDDIPLEYDVDCDCQFHFFCERSSTTADAAFKGDWVVKYVKLIYSKDKIVPVDGQRVPQFTPAELKPYPQGYKYLGAAQARLGHDMDLELPTPKDERRWLDLYGKMAEWLGGSEDVDLVGCSEVGSGQQEKEKKK